MASYYPPVGFHFRVTFEFKQLDPKVEHDPTEYDVMFQSVSGLEVSLETESVKEGGENRFEHALPGRTKYGSLTLKRGLLLPSKSGVAKWCIDAFKNFKIVPINLVVSMLNEQHQPLLSWNVAHAWPKSWKFNELSADKGEIFIETLELHYNRFELME